MSMIRKLPDGTYLFHAPNEEPVHCIKDDTKEGVYILAQNSDRKAINKALAQDLYRKLNKTSSRYA